MPTRIPAKEPLSGQPVGFVEECIVQCFKIVINMSTVERHTGFFHIGGDSILAIKAASIARSQVRPPQHWYVEPSDHVCVHLHPHSVHGDVK